MRIKGADRQLLQFVREWQRLIRRAKVQAESKLNFAVLKAAGDACEIGIGKALRSLRGAGCMGWCL